MIGQLPPWAKISAMDLALDQDGDLAFSGGDLVLITGAEEVAQRIRIRLRLFRGEWFLDEGAGVPYFERILGAKLGRQGLVSIVREELRRVQGVASIESLSAEIEGRRARITFRVTTNAGEVAEGAEEISA